MLLSYLILINLQSIFHGPKSPVTSIWTYKYKPIEMISSDTEKQVPLG